MRCPSNVDCPKCEGAEARVAKRDAKLKAESDKRRKALLASLKLPRA